MKSEFVLFRKNRCKLDLSTFSLRIDSESISPKPSARNLGVYFDCDLAWSAHLDVLVRKVSRKIGVLRRHRNFLSLEARSAFLRAIIGSDLDYCSPVWSDNSPGVVNRLLLLSKRSLRAAEGPGRRHRAGNLDLLHSSYNMTSLLDRRKLQLATLVFKCLNGLAPPGFSSLYRFVSSNDFTRLSDHGVELLTPRTTSPQAISCVPWSVSLEFSIFFHPSS